MDKVLIGSPVYDGMSYCFPDFLNHLKEIDYSNFDVLIVDNSRTKNFFRKIKGIPGIKAIHDETNEERNMFRLISSRNKIIDYAIKKGYDYLLMMDCDVMARKDILKRLIFHKKDVISGLYFNVFKVDGEQKLLPVCYKELEQEAFEMLKNKGMLPPFVQSKSDLRRNITKEEIEIGEVLEVLYPSSGCLLLSKKAFTSGALYGLLEEKNNLKSTDDIYFIEELRKKNFKIYCDPQLICKHDISGKYKSGKHEVYD